MGFVGSFRSSARTLGVVLVSSVLASCATARPPEAPAPKAETTDVVIVGAGVAGLTAAKELQKAGRSFVVLEAQDRIGGRALVDATTFKVPIDYGAAWLHGVEKNPLVPIADGLGFHRVDTDLDGPIYVGNRLATEKESDACGETWELLEKKLEEAAGRGHDPSPNDLVPKSVPCRELMLDNVGRFEAAVEIEQTSTIDAAEFDSGDDDFLKEGIGSFVAKYGKDVPVRLKSAVTKIEYGADGVVAHVAGGERVRAKRALITVSTGVLAARKIAFDPPLPEWKQDAIAGLPMGLLNKVVLQFKTDIFGDSKANSWTMWDGPGSDNIAWVIKPLDAPIAVAFYGAKQAVKFEKDEAAAVAHAKQALRKMYGKRVDTEFEKHAVTKWGQNPWTLGSYSAARPHHSRMHAVMAKPVDDRVFFAGEACSRPVFNGSLAGAYESAVGASKLIEESLGRTVSPAASMPAEASP
jgi:monoamine oxidase